VLGVQAWVGCSLAAVVKLQRCVASAGHRHRRSEFQDGTAPKSTVATDTESRSYRENEVRWCGRKKLVYRDMTENKQTRRAAHRSQARLAVCPPRSKADLIRGLSAVIVRCTSIPAPIPRCSAFAGGLAATPLVAGAVLGAGGQGLSEIGAAKQSNTGVVSRAAASLLSRLFFSASTPRVLRRETQTSLPLP
jgi:hypothetical protein